MRPVTAAAVLMLLGPAPALACSCTWMSIEAMPPEMRALAEEHLRAAAARVQYAVEGEVVADSTMAACRQGPLDIAQPAYLTLRVDRAIRGRLSGMIQVRQPDVTRVAPGCAANFNSCEVHPAVGARATWALDFRDGEWRLVDYCTHDAFGRSLRAARTRDEREDDAAGTP